MILEEVCNKYYIVIYNKCLNKLFYNSSAAQDTTQEIFSALCRKWDSLERKDEEYIVKWLQKTANIQILKERAKYSIHLKKVVSDYSIESNTDNSLDMDQQIICNHLLLNFDSYYDSVISELNDKEIELIKCLKKNMKYREIAEVMNMNETTVAMAVCRLRKKVSTIVEKTVEKIFEKI